MASHGGGKMFLVEIRKGVTPKEPQRMYGLSLWRNSSSSKNLPRAASLVLAAVNRAAKEFSQNTNSGMAPRLPHCLVSFATAVAARLRQQRVSRVHTVAHPPRYLKRSDARATSQFNAVLRPFRAAVETAKAQLHASNGATRSLANAGEVDKLRCMEKEHALLWRGVGDEPVKFGKEKNPSQPGRRRVEETGDFSLLRTYERGGTVMWHRHQRWTPTYSSRRTEAAVQKSLWLVRQTPTVRQPQALAAFTAVAAGTKKISRHDSATEAGWKTTAAANATHTGILSGVAATVRRAVVPTERTKAARTVTSTEAPAPAVGWAALSRALVVTPNNREKMLCVLARKAAAKTASEKTLPCEGFAQRVISVRSTNSAGPTCHLMAATLETLCKDCCRVPEVHLEQRKRGFPDVWRPFTRWISSASSAAGEPRSSSRVPVQLSKKELRGLQGHPRRYKLMGGRPEFHHVDRNRNGHIIEPTDKFQVVMTTSKNNVHAQVLNKSRAYRTIFGSFAGNVGYRKRAQQEPQCAYRIGQNIARKCRRLGIGQVDVKFRRIMRVEQLLQAFAAHGLGVTSITHEPRLPKCGQNATKPRKRRRV